MSSVKCLAGWTRLALKTRNFSTSTIRTSFNPLNMKKVKFTSEDSNDGLRRIVMNDMSTRNSLSMEMMTELVEAINLNKSGNTLRAMTIEATDGPVFSAGHNLKEMTADKGIDAQKRIFTKCTELMMSIRKAEVPVIGLVNGLAAAAGCQLISSCDFAIATSLSKFSTPGASFGLFCSTPGVGVSRVVNRSTAAFMVLTGMPLSAEEAQQAGLITKVVLPLQLEHQLTEIYSHIKSKSRPVLKLGKDFFYSQLNYSYEEAMKQGEITMVKNLQFQDCQEGLLSFKEKRSPKWTHHQ